MTARKLVAVTFLALSMCAFAFAQEKEGEGAPPMGPPDELKSFEHLVGTWTCDFQMRMTPESEWTTSPATMVYEKAMDGACIRGSFSNTVMGMDFKGLATLSYHREKAKWQMSWIDNMGAYQNLLEGDFKDGKLTLDGEDVAMGQQNLIRDITKLKSDTEIDWEMRFSGDGGKTWWTTMKASYKKQG
ncbi:MAG: DUF1579 family protein [Candidatus Zixiibacteriota bacterium]